MKGKFRLMWRVVITLVLALSLGLVMATPAAADVTTATVTVDPTTISQAAQYTIAFTTTEDLAQSANDDIRIEFPSDTTVPVASAIEGNVTINGNTVGTGKVTVVSRLVTLKVPVDIITGSVTVIFATGAGIVNPSTAASYTVDVSTSREVTPITSGTYDITPLPPTVTGVSPATGVQGAVALSVVITGTNFLTATAVSFGAGITASITSVDSDTQITASLNINAAATLGYRDVSVTTPSGTGTLTDGFEVIAPPPTVISVAPPEANQGETLDVVITGTNLSGVTAVSFGSLITVTFTVDSATEITASITIDSTAITGLRDVSVTTAAGTGTGEDVFTVGTAGTALVDIYNAAMDYLESKASITEAIGVTNAKTLIAHAADYEEKVVINQSITLESYMGAASTTIDASAETAAAAVEITASTVTLGGEGAGFTVIAEDRDSLNPGINHKAIHLTGAVDNVTIEGNAITGGDLSPQLGILIGTYGLSETYSNIKILNNDFNTTWDVAPPEANPTCGGIKSWTTTTLDGTLLIDTNTITGFTVGMNLRNLKGTNTVPAVISNNTVNGNGYNGIEVSGDNTDWLEIRGNHIYDNGGNGVAISGGTAANVKVEQNDIYGNGNGVKVYDGVSVTSISINYNDIYNNTNTSVTTHSDSLESFTYENYGVFNANKASGSDLDAKYNFWSDPNATPLDISGPSSATYTADEAPNWWAGTALGTGDIAGAGATDATVYATVLYDPWLTRSQAIAVSDGIAYHGSTSPLEAGWNTLSVPLALDDGADTLDDIVALGDFFVISGTDQNYLGGYYYDAVNGLWLPIPGAYEFAPCKAVYVKIAAGGASFPVLYSGVLSLPSLSLSEGWNLIGSAFGIDKTASDYGIAATNDPDGKKLVDEALVSLGANASVVVSPSMPGQTLAWATVATDHATEMIVGEGYWVFMTDPAPLAGFEVTPIYKIFLP